MCGVTRWLRGPSALFLALCLLWRWRVSAVRGARVHGVTHGRVLLLYVTYIKTRNRAVVTNASMTGDKIGRGARAAAARGWAARVVRDEREPHERDREHLCGLAGPRAPNPALARSALRRAGACKKRESERAVQRLHSRSSRAPTPTAATCGARVPGVHVECVTWLAFRASSCCRLPAEGCRPASQGCGTARTPAPPSRAPAPRQSWSSRATPSPPRRREGTLPAP